MLQLMLLYEVLYIFNEASFNSTKSHTHEKDVVLFFAYIAFRFLFHLPPPHPELSTPQSVR